MKHGNVVSLKKNGAVLISTMIYKVNADKVFLNIEETESYMVCRELRFFLSLESTFVGKNVLSRERKKP